MREAPIRSGKLSRVSAPLAASPPPHPANVWQLMLNELFKLWKQPLVWQLIALDLFVVLSAWVVLAFTILQSPGSFAGGHLFTGPSGLADAIGQPMLLGRRAGEFIVVVLAGVAFGGEFNTGSIRLILSRGVSRVGYLTAKYVALVVTCTFLALAGILLSSLLVNLLPLLHPAAPTLLNLDGDAIAGVAGLFLGTLQNYLCCLVLGSALGLIFRSAIVGAAAGLGWMVVEEIGARFLPALGATLHPSLGRQLAQLLFTPNLNASFAEALPPRLAATLGPVDGTLACRPTGAVCHPSSLGQALLVSLVWGLALFALSTILFLQRDVLE
jgi:ABC-2 type transport system permease protein